MKTSDTKQIYKEWRAFVETGTINSGSVRKEIAESWKRCLFEYRLDPHAEKRPIRLSPEEIAERCQKKSVFLESARPFLQVLGAAVHGSGFIITVSDEEGYVLEVLGDEEILEMAAANNYRPGCRRSEDEVGTNAIGLALHEKKAVQLTGCEHFNVHHHLWTCSSSPVFSPKGDVLGALTLSGKSLGIHQHTLGMVISAARAVENKIREEELSREKGRLGSYLDSLLDSVSEGILAIQLDGTVTHINRIAERMLQISKEKMLEKSLKSVFEIDSRLWREVLDNNQLSDQEMMTTVSGRPKSFILSTRPIDVNGETLGKILILTEKRRVYELIHRFAGSHARFTFDDIVGECPQLIRQIELARIAAQTDSRILLVGESGTGKELFAQAIHNESKQKNGPFVAVSCAAVPRELIESELFGYQEGAFTGSRKGGQVGKFELADGGTLFLDEISSMPFEMQAKILRVLQENEICRLGDTKSRKVNVRVIAATNKDLMEEVLHKHFREDLYFRLNVVEIVIPPLRERGDDLPRLIEHILRRISKQLGKDDLTISVDAIKVLDAYPWPGNVRELENYLERASIACDGRVIKPENLTSRLLNCAKPAGNVAQALKLSKEEEEQLIIEALKKCRGNVSESARKLQISRSTLHRLMKIHKLSPYQFHN